MSGLIAFLDPWLPRLAPDVQSLVRIAYGVVLAATLARTLSHAWFFLSERWNGYSQSTRPADAIQNPTVRPVLLAVWMASAGLIAVGVWSPWPALVNVLLARYFFVQQRWTSVLRGMGAPGFMLYWVGAVVFLLEYATHHAPQLHRLVLLVAQIDLACIMASAGLYKLAAGYAQNAGMEFGLANPAWGRWWKTYASLSPRHWLFRALNHLAWSTELVIAVLAVIPATRVWAGALLMLSFAWIATQLRLGLLCETVMIAGLLFAGGRHAGVESAAVSSLATDVLGLTLLTYLVMLPCAYAGLFFNLFGRRALPALLQRALERYTNACGLIIWRVFSADHTDFFLVIHRRPRGRGPDQPISSCARYRHVAESIALTTLFTTRKYYPANQALFAERVLRYARTVPCPADAVLVFTCMQIRKDVDGFTHQPLMECIVDLVAGSVEERRVGSSTPPFLRAGSPVFEAARPGTYAPAHG